jgi:hypothetical protein
MKLKIFCRIILEGIARSKSRSLRRMMLHSRKLLTDYEVHGQFLCSRRNAIAPKLQMVVGLRRKPDVRNKKED